MAPLPYNSPAYTNAILSDMSMEANHTISVSILQSGSMGWGHVEKGLYLFESYEAISMYRASKYLLNFDFVLST